MLVSISNSVIPAAAAASGEGSFQRLLCGRSLQNMSHHHMEPSSSSERQHSNDSGSMQTCGCEAAVAETGAKKSLTS